MQESQAALDDVKVVIPDGMTVKSHKDTASKPKEEAKPEDPDEIIEQIQEGQQN